MKFARPLALALVSAALLAPAGVAAATAPSAERDAGPELRATFNNIKRADGSRVSKIRLSGSADLTASVLDRNGGMLRAATSRPGQSRAVRFPAFDGSVGGSRATIRITNPTGVDELNPGVRNFSYGSDFILDAQSSAPGSTDEGDNLFQRGLFTDADQYKVQVDGRQPSCRVAGSVGGAPAAVLVKSTVVVNSTHWYRAECIRKGRTLTVAVTRFNPDGTTDVTRTSATSEAVIDVTMSSTSVPLSIGGAINEDGQIYAQNDQFNGRIDNVTLRIR